MFFLQDLNFTLREQEISKDLKNKSIFAYLHKEKKFGLGNYVENLRTSKD